MIELRLLAALAALDRARERGLARGLGSPRAQAAVGGLALGWLVRALTLRSAR